MTELDHRQVVAIDGPGGAGKSTVASILADRIDAMLFDTGALYRAVTLAATRRGIAGSDALQLASLAGSLEIRIRPATVDDGRPANVLMNGEDVTWAIRTPAIDARVSEISAHPAVREALLGVQRDIANGARVVIVGRDIGTVVVPNAGAKIFLEAGASERARRRLAELQARGVAATYEQVFADLTTRDAFDSGREAAPLAPAHDATKVDTDGRTIDEVVDAIQRLVESAWRKVGVADG